MFAGERSKPGTVVPPVSLMKSRAGEATYELSCSRRAVPTQEAMARSSSPVPTAGAGAALGMTLGVSVGVVLGAVSGSMPGAVRGASLGGRVGTAVGTGSALCPQERSSFRWTPLRS